MWMLSLKMEVVLIWYTLIYLGVKWNKSNFKVTPDSYSMQTSSRPASLLSLVTICFRTVSPANDCSHMLCSALPSPSWDKSRDPLLLLSPALPRQAHPAAHSLPLTAPHTENLLLCAQSTALSPALGCKIKANAKPAKEYLDVRSEKSRDLGSSKARVLFFRQARAPGPPAICEGRAGHTACSTPELMVICKTRGGLLMNPRPSIYWMFELDNWGSLCSVWALLLQPKWSQPGLQNHIPCLS